ncbi:MAG: glycosyltransferase, partial [Alphaproteobacteria bacterium]
MSGERPLVSVVAPVFREEGNVAEFCRRVAAPLEGITPLWEARLVAEGGRGASVARLLAEARRQPRDEGRRVA